MNAWPFLIGNSGTYGFSVVVAPQFLEGLQCPSLLLETAGGELTQSGQARYREVHTPSRVISLIFRVIRAEEHLVGLEGNDLLRDKFGRPATLIEGFVMEGKNPDVQVTEDDLRSAHEQVLPAYRDFWKEQKDVPSIRPSTSFALHAADAESVYVELIKMLPFTVGAPVQLSPPSCSDVEQDESLGGNTEIDRSRARIIKISVSLLLTAILILILILIIRSHQHSPSRFPERSAPQKLRNDFSAIPIQSAGGAK